MASSSKMKVVLLALEWGFKRGGLSTFNRELAIQLAKHPDVQVSVFLPRCDKKEKDAAQKNNVTLVQATQMPDYDETYWLCFPPDDLQIDFVIGHGVTLGRQAQIIRGIRQCKWIQFVLTEPEELGIIKDYSGAISKGGEEHRGEVYLCEMADLVVAVGSKLAEAYRYYLRRKEKDQKVFALTPGIFSEFCNFTMRDQDISKCQVLAVGRGDAEDFSLKGFDIAARAVGSLDYVYLIVVGARTEQRDELRLRFQNECGMPQKRLKIRNFTETREHERLEQLFSEVDLVIMPSRIDDFGLVALEAMSTGLPVIVSANSGFGEALRKVAFGSECVIHSEDADDWATAIETFWEKETDVRSEESKGVRDSYAKGYSWEEQCKQFVQEMRIMLDADSIIEDPERPAPTIVEAEGVPTSKRKPYSPGGASLSKKTAKSSPGVSEQTRTESSPGDHCSTAAQSSGEVTGVSGETQTETSPGEHILQNTTTQSSGDKTDHCSTVAQSSGEVTDHHPTATPRDPADWVLSPLANELEKTKLGDE